LSGFAAIDIVENGMGVRPGATRAPFEYRLRQGVYDTNVEAALVSGCCGGPAAGTAVAYREDAAAGDKWQTLRTPADVDGLAGVSADTIARIRADVTAGHAVVASAAAVSSGGGWWRIDPRSGDALGIAPGGGGQAGTETATEKATVPAKLESAEIFGKLVMLVFCMGASTLDLMTAKNNVDKGIGIASLILCLLGGGMENVGYATNAKGAMKWGSNLTKMITGLSLGKRFYATRSSGMTMK
jgi:hypothetical protein